MRYMILSLLLFGCMTQAPKQTAAPPVPPAPPAPPVARIDTAKPQPAAPDRTREIDSLQQVIVLQGRQLRHDMDSVAKVNDTLAARLLHARLVISNVRYYLNLALKNPTQDKFLKGWIRRALQ